MGIGIGSLGRIGVSLVLLSGLAAPLAAAPLQPADVPAPLKPWVPWVLRGHETGICPTLPADSDEPVCAWAGRLTLALDARGGHFTQEWQVHARTHVPLPGDAEHWPLDVKVDGKPAAVVEHEDGPSVELPPGKHALAGGFQWPSLPESLPVPNATGLVSVTVAGRRLDFPRRTDKGELFLQKEEAPAETDSLQITVHRKLADGVPLVLTTRVSLEVAGKAREVTLGRSLPAGFEASALESELPARVEADGRLRLQVRPGSFTLTLTARGAGDLGRGSFKVTRPAPDGPWKEGEEVWVFEAAPSLRVVTPGGVPNVDPAQTALPAEWKRLPAYLLAPGATLTVAEQQRGDAVPAADDLKLSRRLWLDFDGRGYTIEDHVTGVFRRSWRLSMGPTEKLGRVTANGTDQFITRLAGGGGDDGVEIRQGPAQLVTESRIVGATRTFPVAGWAHDFQSVGATLELPPGWRLLHATGADHVSDTWLERWTLLDLFLVLVCALAAAKLFGPRAGVLTLVALGLSVTEPSAPQWLWLAVLAGEALARALGGGRLERPARALQLGVWIALVLAVVPYAAREVRIGLFPAQEGGHAAEENIAYFQEPAATPAAQTAEAPAPAADAEERVARGRAEEGKLGKRKAASDDKTLELLGTLGAGAAGSSDRVGGLALIGSGSGGRQSGLRGPPSGMSAPRAQNLATYDPSVIVQTGPGLPRWSWRTVAFMWNGPVERTQELSLWLLSPAAAAVLAFLRVALIAALAWLLWRGPRATLRGLFSPAAAVAAAWLVLAAPTPARAADFPPNELLEQLRTGLLEKPACAPNCATLGRLAVEATPDRLRLRFEVSAAAASTVALPGQRDHWRPADILVDGRPGPQTFQDDAGTLWLAVVAGSHQIILEGPLPERDVVQLALPQKPHVVSSTLRGWRLAGVGDDGEIADTLQLSREASAPGSRGAGSHALAASSLPPFVTVERTLSLGLKWQVMTRVVRATPTGAAVLLSVPLLPGESPLDGALRVSHGNVQVSLGPDAEETSWTSALEQRPVLVLMAARAPSFSEVWRLDLGPIWHAERTGIPPVHPSGDGAARVPQWRPWPGETVTLAVTRPRGAEGQNLTIEKVDVTVTPGARSAAVTVTFELRSSRGGEHVVTLPDDATLEALTVDGRTQPLRTNGARVTLPLHPGAQTAQLKYRDPRGLAALFRPRLPDMGAPTSNVQLELELPSDRWILFAGGPRLGPSVLFWSELVVLLLVALALGRATLTPLRARHWVLLGLGLSQVPLPAAAMVAGCFLALGLRARHPGVHRPWMFDLRQLGLVAWVLIALVVMFAAVREGLLSSPDMHVAGNGSQGSTLRWFTDRGGATPPGAWVVSLPLLVYRIAMLLWALWLASALIRWARWAWNSFGADGLWRPLRKPKVAAP